MKEIERLKIALLKSDSVVYEWDVLSDEISWSGDMISSLSVASADRLSNKKRLLSLIHNDDREKYLSSLDLSIAQEGNYSRSFRLCSASGVVIKVKDKGCIVDDDGRKVLVGTMSVIDAEAIVGRDAINSNVYDDENIFENRYYKGDFISALNATFAESKNRDVSNILLKISIDNMPMMMMWYSLDFAERIMEALEIELKRLLKKQDVIKRISVDQFGVILQDRSKKELETLIDKVLKQVQLYKNPSFEEAIHLRTSIGSVFFPSSADDTEDALNKAYLALSSAKSKSNEFYCDYQDAKKEHLDSKDHANKIRYMQKALSEDRLLLAFQPVIKGDTGKIEEYECLLRVKEEDGSLVSAGNFIPIAEKMGVIDIIDQFVLEKVVEELKQHKDITLGFNVSNLTTDNPKWLRMCKKLLKGEEEVASRIIVEITETAAQRDMRQTAYFVAALQALGCRVALDDFGAGYTSFRQLKSLSVDMVKIDGSYIMGLEESSENLMFIKTLLEFNRSYGLQTIAECVETGEVAKMLMEMKIDYMQGYYFGKPDVLRPWAGEREEF